ncbi:MAG: hypothetical protein MJ183_10210, partial [Treponemataceae bacterium]|nr:hypothetical protein [Treponemataceae bacterium]
MKQLFDLNGIIVSKDDQIFQGESATVTIDMADAVKSFSFNATSDPVENGYPIRFEVSDPAVVSVTQSASDPSKYTINATGTGWCDVTVMCSVAYKFDFIVYVTDNATGVSEEALENRRNEYYAFLGAGAEEPEVSGPLYVSETTPVIIYAESTEKEVLDSVHLSSEIPALDEEVSYQWYINGKAAGIEGYKPGRVEFMDYRSLEAGVQSIYLEITGKTSGNKAKSETVQITFKYIDHRPEYAGAWVKDAAATDGKYMAEDGNIYDMYKDAATGEWTCRPGAVATLASTGYVVTDHVAGNQTETDYLNDKLIVRVNGVKNEYVRAAITPRTERYVDSTTKVVISADKSSLGVGESVRIDSKISILDEPVSYQWYIDGTAVTYNNRGTKSYYEDDCSEPRTFEYYVVVKGYNSGVSVTSNKVKVTFTMPDHRPEYAGAWIKDKTANGGKYVTADGKIYDMYQDEETKEWVYKPEVVATMQSYGYSITDNVARNKTTIRNGKIYVTANGVESSYSKSNVTPRAAK